MPKPRSLREAWQEMRETWQRQQADPDYYFDTPLPETAKSVREDTPADLEASLEASIGDLAPEGLQ